MGLIQGIRDNNTLRDQIRKLERELQEKETTSDFPPFDFGALYEEPDTDEGIMKYVPILTLVAQVVTIAVILFR